MITQQSEFFWHAMGPLVSAAHVAALPEHPELDDELDFELDPDPEPPSCFLLLLAAVPSRTPESLSAPTGEDPELQATSAKAKATMGAERSTRFMGDSRQRG